MAEKLFYTMGEVAEMFDVKASLLRHWETQFPQLRPKRNAKGNRLYTGRDIEILKQIYLLVKERGMTLDGAKRALKQQRGGRSGVNRDAELLERLQRIRSLLEEVREDLRGEESLAADDAVEPGAAALSVPDSAAAETVAAGVSAHPVSDSAAAPEPLSVSAPESVPVFSVPEPEPAGAAAEPGALFVPSPSGEAENAAAGSPAIPAPGQPSPRRRRRKKEDAENRELFAFYEQSLF